MAIIHRFLINGFNFFFVGEFSLELRALLFRGFIAFYLFDQIYRNDSNNHFKITV